MILLELNYKMPRNSQYLSQKELFDKTTDMIEHAVNGKIVLQYTRDMNWCNYEGTEKGTNLKKFKINIATPPQKHISQYTALLHELSHVLYDSPFTPTRKLMAKWCEDEGQQRFYAEIFNILEDERIESHLTRAYAGTKDRFEKTTHDLGKSLPCNASIADDPGYILLAIRFHRDDLVSGLKNYKFYKKAINDVSRTDKFGGLRVLISIKKYLDNFYQFSTYSMPKSKDGTSNAKSRSRSKNSITHTSKDCRIPDELIKENYTEQEIDDLLDAGRGEGEKQYQKIREALLDDHRQDNTPSNVKKIIRFDESYEIDQIISKGLKRIFRLLKMREKSFIDYTGCEVDVNEYVKNFIKGTNLNKSYSNNQMDHGVSIIVSIDASGSMRGKPIDTARNLVATLFESVKDISNIDIRGNVWGGSSYGTIGITEINNISDVKQISIMSSYGYTPTHAAIEYSTGMLKKMKGRNKLLILLTDGNPQFYNNSGACVPTSVYIKRCKKSLQKALRVTPNVLCVMIAEDDDDYERSSLLMDKLFGSKRFIIVNNMNQASEKIIKKFRRFIFKNIVNPL